MKVLNIINVRWYNATAWYGHMLSLGLEALGHKTAVMGLPGTPPVIKAKEAGLQTYEAELNSLNPLKLIKSAAVFGKAVKEFKPDVVVCHRGEFFFYFTHVRFWEKPEWKLVRVRGDRRPPKADALSRWLYHNAVDKVVTSSESMRRFHLDNLKLPPNKVVTLYGGVETELFSRNEDGRQRVRHEFGFSDNDFVLGILGRYDTVKGHESLFRAVEELRNEGMDKIRLLIAGVDACMNEKDIKLMLENRGIQGITAVTGKRDDIADVISAMDLGVIPSLGSEAVCRVGMEMLSCGVPVIGSDIGVIPEIIPPSNIFIAGDVQSIKNRIRDYKAYHKSYDYIDFAEQFASFFN
ncbi:glycosyltransferase [Geovibrio thiophilus]|uniref:Glycosyltransferase n=1 Tax=Geovibrio thiophilus TaxID=139438 RepID=A0A410K150_9BACT|nr:glycosyltransferase [Geovibrio thiophilus]QAR34091.1 glycosyltransferase [Geovibrio thiophilus]